MGFPILEGPAGWKKDEYAPLRHMIAERKSNSGALRTDCASNCAIILGSLCAVFPLLLEIVTV